MASLLEERNLSKITTALLAEKSGVTEAALYRHFPSKRAIYAELFSFCDDAIFAKCGELKKSDLDPKFYNEVFPGLIVKVHKPKAVKKATKTKKEKKPMK